MSQRYTLHKPAVPAVLSLPYEKELNPEQFKVVTQAKGPTLVLAGPGSGKTRTLTYRVAYLLEQKIPPREILLVTFTVKAAREMLQRVEQLLKSKPEGLWGGTFHHIGNMVLRRHAELLGRTPTFGILDEEDATDLVAACVSDIQISRTKSRLPQANVLESIFSFSANTMRSIEQIVLAQYPQFSDHLAFIQEVHQLYAKRKRQANLMDYDDLMTGWLEIMQNSCVGPQYAQQFRYVLVDEYQDTNRLQYELIKSLAAVHGNLLVVGDDAQAIYAFRGADLANLLTFPETFPGSTIHRLETNYRSTPEILQLANASIALNQKQFPKELKSVHPAGPLPAVVPLADLRQQASFIAQRILELREEGTPIEEMAVLFRARYHSAELELELAKRNIPYVVRGGVRFFEQAHIKDLLAYLRILNNPHDEISWERVLRLQEGIGPAFARRIYEELSKSEAPLEKARSNGGFEDLPKRVQSSWSSLRKTFRELNQAGVSHQPAEALSLVLKSGYASYIETRFEDASARREDVEQLILLAGNYQSMEKFVEDLTLREPFKGESIRGWQQPDEFLVLSTIHQAKGLEWTAVFLIGLVEGQFPHPKALEDPEQMEEERRLFYVAVTRTKKELYLTYPLTRYTAQRGEVLMRPSQFIQELPENLFELWRVAEEFTSGNSENRLDLDLDLDQEPLIPD